MAGRGGKRSTSWRPGHSGNLRGRPQGLGEFRELCQDKSEAALERIERLAQGGRGIPKSVQLAANIYIVDQAWGKPTQPLAGADGGDLNFTFEIETGRGDEREPALEAAR